MYEATLALLEALTNHAKGRLVIMRAATPDDQDKRAITDMLIKLNDLLDKARHELKGGA